MASDGSASPASRDGGRGGSYAGVWADRADGRAQGMGLAIAGPRHRRTGRKSESRLPSGSPIGQRHMRSLTCGPWRRCRPQVEGILFDGGNAQAFMRAVARIWARPACGPIAREPARPARSPSRCSLPSTALRVTPPSAIGDSDSRTGLVVQRDLSCRCDHRTRLQSATCAYLHDGRREPSLGLNPSRTESILFSPMSAASARKPAQRRDFAPEASMRVRLENVLVDPFKPRRGVSNASTHHLRRPNFHGRPPWNTQLRAARRSWRVRRR